MRSITSIAMLKRSISLLMASSIGVLMLPFSLYPRTCIFGWLVRRYAKPVNQPRIAVEVEDDRLVDGKQGVEIAIRQPVRVLRAGLQLEQVDHIDETDLEIGKVCPQQRDRGQRFLSGNVAGGCQHHVGFAALVVAGPIPNADALGAVSDGCIHVHVLKMHLFVGDNYVDVVLAPQTMIGDRKKGVDVRRKIDAGHLGALVHDHVEETGVLVGKTVVVLAPDGRGDQQVQGGNLFAPGQADCRSTAIWHVD